MVLSPLKYCFISLVNYKFIGLKNVKNKFYFYFYLILYGILIKFINLKDRPNLFKKEKKKV